MFINKKISLIILVFLLSFIFALSALAETPAPAPTTSVPAATPKVSAGVQSFGESVFGGSYTPPQVTAAMLISVALTFLGIIFVALIIYGGFLYMTGGGNQDKVKKAKDVIVKASIGLAIVILAYSIAFLVISALNMQGSTGSGGGDDTTETGGIE